MTRIPRRKMGKKLTIILKNFENDTICILVLIFNWFDSLTDKEEWHSGALTPQASISCLSGISRGITWCMKTPYYKNDDS
jgi:hypothetical protein